MASMLGYFSVTFDVLATLLLVAFAIGVLLAVLIPVNYVKIRRALGSRSQEDLIAVVRFFETSIAAFGIMAFAALGFGVVILSRYGALVAFTEAQFAEHYLMFGAALAAFPVSIASSLVMYQFLSRSMDYLQDMSGTTHATS